MGRQAADSIGRLVPRGCLLRDNTHERLNHMGIPLKSVAKLIRKIDDTVRRGNLTYDFLDYLRCEDIIINYCYEGKGNAVALQPLYSQFIIMRNVAGSWAYCIPDNIVGRITERALVEWEKLPL